jgi:hypothetical protein
VAIQHKWIAPLAKKIAERAEFVVSSNKLSPKVLGGAYGDAHCAASRLAARVRQTEGEREMTRSRTALLMAVSIFALSSEHVSAESPKELKIRSGSSVALANFTNPRPDCSANPGPIPVPVVREKPSNGVIQILIVVTDVAASGTCPARKIPSTALIYTPNKDFLGTDSVQIEVEDTNGTTSVKFRITVQATSQPF